MVAIAVDLPLQAHCQPVRGNLSAIINRRGTSMNPWLQFFADPLRKKAVFCLVVLGVLPQLSTFNKFPLSQALLGVVLTVLQAFYLVWLIHLLRGEEKQHKNKPQWVTSIGLWGYVWRVLVIYWASASVMVLGVLLLGMRPPPGNLPLLWIVSMNVGLMSAMPLVCWLLFSRDRKGQLLWLVSSVR
jgi:hypothetical protein